MQPLLAVALWRYAFGWRRNTGQQESKTGLCGNARRAKHLKPSSLPIWPLILVPLMIPLSGCVRAGSDAVCPPLVAYSEDFQAQAAQEMTTCTACANMQHMVRDYGNLRDMVRAACK